MSNIDNEMESLGLEKLPRDSAQGWFKFENVGDGIAGEIVDMFYVPAKGGMNEQRAFTLKRADGTVWNVGLKWTSYILSRTDMLEVGDIVGFKFEKEIPAKMKGYSPAKSITVMSKLKQVRTGLNASKLAAPGGAVVESEADKQFNELSKDDGVNPDDIPFP